MDSAEARLQVFADLEQLSQAAAELIVERARQAVAAQGRFCMALAGGSTPQRTYQLLASKPLRDHMPWPGVHLFWGDERCVAPDDPRSNARMVREKLLDLVPLPAAQIHPIDCARDPQVAAQAYAELLQGTFPAGGASFDLVLLGLGEDGHTASLFPGTSALRAEDGLVAPVQVAGEPFARLTLTVPILNRSRLVLFLVAGERKAQILSQVLHGPAGRFPAQHIAPVNGELLWMADRAAATRIAPRRG